MIGQGRPVRVYRSGHGERGGRRGPVAFGNVPEVSRDRRLNVRMIGARECRFAADPSRAIDDGETRVRAADIANESACRARSHGFIPFNRHGEALSGMCRASGQDRRGAEP